MVRAARVGLLLGSALVLHLIQVVPSLCSRISQKIKFVPTDSARFATRAKRNSVSWMETLGTASVRSLVSGIALLAGFVVIAGSSGVTFAPLFSRRPFFVAADPSSAMCVRPCEG